MELKTHEVAKELGMSPRTIRKWVKKYKIPCIKNDYGHYVYDQKAISRLAALKASSEVAGTLDVYEASQTHKEITKQNHRPSSENMHHQISALLERMSRTEQLLQQKADEVVSYQLLQQRKEIEELTKKIEVLESTIENLEMKQAQKYEPPLIFDQPIKATKRRGVFRSIFGL